MKWELGVVLLIAGLPMSVRAEGLAYEAVATIEVEFVAEIAATNGAVSNVTAASPLPSEWPGQSVELIGQATTPGVQVVVRGEKGVAAWMEIAVPRIPAGGRVTVSRTYRLTRSAISTTLPIAELDTVSRPSRAMRRHLGTAPGVEPRDRRVRTLADSLTQEAAPAGARAAAFANWVRSNVRYRYDPIYRGATTCLKDSVGDCDDMTALFVSLCRASDIPARTVWIEDHAYAEFLLVDDAGDEFWIPFDPASRSPLGSVKQTRPILQKGDDFRDPFTRRRVHYVPQGVRAIGAPVAFRSERRVKSTR